MIYLDNASTSYPKPKACLEKVVDYVQNYGVSTNRSHSPLSNKALALCEETRQMLSELIGIAQKSHIVFTMNATHALNIAIKGTLKPGDHVLICNYSHNSVLRPVEKLNQLGLISYDIFIINQEGEIDFGKLQSQITKNTSMVIVNHASNVTGVKIDIKKISAFCTKNQLLFLLDATQSIIHEVIDLNETNVDLLACTGHKSMLGPTGIGFLYIKNPATVDSLIEGGSGGTSSISTIHPEAMPYKFEAGTQNILSIAGLNGALSYIFSIGVKVISEHCIQLEKMLYKALTDIEEIEIYGTSVFNKKVPILSFNIKNVFPNQASYFYEKQHNIIVRSGIHCSPKIHQYLGTFPNGTIRVSPGPFSTIDDINTFISATKQLIYHSNSKCDLTGN